MAQSEREQSKQGATGRQPVERQAVLRSDTTSFPLTEQCPRSYGAEIATATAVIRSTNPPN